VDDNSLNGLCEDIDQWRLLIIGWPVKTVFLSVNLYSVFVHSISPMTWSAQYYNLLHLLNIILHLFSGHENWRDLIYENCKSDPSLQTRLLDYLTNGRSFDYDYDEAAYFAKRLKEWRNSKNLEHLLNLLEM
jgi:hypothetical protein